MQYALYWHGLVLCLADMTDTNVSHDFAKAGSMLLQYWYDELCDGHIYVEDEITSVLFSILKLCLILSSIFVFTFFIDVILILWIWQSILFVCLWLLTEQGYLPCRVSNFAMRLLEPSTTRCDMVPLAIYCDLVTPCGSINLSQHSLRLLLVFLH